MRKQKYPAGITGFGDLSPSNFKFSPQIDGSRIFYFRDLGHIRDNSVCVTPHHNASVSKAYILIDHQWLLFDYASIIFDMTVILTTAYDVQQVT